MARDMAHLLREARALGFTAERTAKGHIKLTRTNPDALVVFSKTPSDARSLKNMRADLRRASDPNHPYGKRVDHGRQKS